MLALYLRIQNWLAEREEGQDLVEYALLLGLIALVAVIAITSAGGAVGRIWDGIVTALETVPTVAN